MALDLTGSGTGNMVTLDELVARLDETSWSLHSPDAAMQVAEWLAALGRNTHFLADLALDELKQQCSGQARDNRYSSQVLLLHRVPGHYLIRANFWPAGDDPTLRASGSDHYFYHQPHDHNFDFLTIGYAGPGYRSRWYERDPAMRQGYIGAPAVLTPVEEGQLSPGRILHYRAHRDVHDQLPPDALSISINIIPERPDIAWHDQYFFDVAGGRISGLPTLASSEILLRIAAVLAPEHGHDLAHDVAVRHPSHRMRWSAWRALIGSAGNADERQRLIGQAAASSCASVAAGAAQLLQHG